MKPKQPPACTFPLAQTTTAESTPEEYTFSEPQVVLSNSNAIYNIFEWLPDNQRILMTQDHLDEKYQSIELFDPQTVETQVYAKRAITYGMPPSWIAGTNAVVYPDLKVISATKSNGMNVSPYKIERQLWISQGDPVNAKLLEDAQLTLDYLSMFSVAVNPDGTQIAYFANTDKHISHRKALKDSVEASQPTTPFDTVLLDYRRKGHVLPAFYKMAWRPNASQIFLYSDENGGSYTFLMDVNYGQLCEVDLFNGKNSAKSEKFASIAIARWSPNGRYLAVIRSWGFRTPTDLAVLDMATGKLSKIEAQQLIPANKEGLLSVLDIAWAPDNQHLAAITRAYEQSSGNSKYLYLVDFLTSQFVEISSPSQNLGSNFGETNLLWSDDASQLIVKCPTQIDRLCLISVQKTIKP